MMLIKFLVQIPEILTLHYHFSTKTFRENITTTKTLKKTKKITTANIEKFA